MIRRAVITAVFLLLATAAAFGNGRFPRAEEFHQGPGLNRDLMVVRTTFGLVVSVDGGLHWEYWCEDALLYGDGYDPPLAYAADGTLLVALQDGLLTTRDGCTFRRQPDLESLTVADLATSPDGRVVYAIAVTRNALPDSRVARSTNDGLSFDFVSAATDFVGVTLATIEVAASDPTRLYASGTLDVDGSPVLYRSSDTGAHWARAGAGFGGATGVFVSGVDGAHPDVVYLRATAPAGEMDAGSADGSGVLFRSDDGGETLREVLRTQGPMRGFALSDDGRRVWAGGPDDGVWRSVDGAAATRFSAEPVECLRWSNGTLWACRTFVLDGALLLRSDGDAPFTVALAADDVGGPPARCQVGTTAHDVCPGRWGVVRRSLVRPTALDASTDRGGGLDPTPAPTGCGCRAGSVESRGGTVWLLALLAVARARTRRTSRANS